MEFLRRLGRLYRAQFRTVGRLRPTLGGLLLRTVAWIVVAWLSLFIAVWLTPGVEIAGRRQRAGRGRRSWRCSRWPSGRC